ncbi:MAG: hypothetical protein IKM42_03515, partial [Clostridia bacterium]|nr:hypothetical protein [Clostridia bacterium]
GQKFFVANLEFEGMFTPEDMHPWSTIAFNNACTVIRLTTHAHNMQVGGTVSANAVASSKVSLMSLGDIYARTARMMRAAYGSYLESDIMTNGHHGSGGEGELYELINPQIILWQNNAAEVAGQISNTSSKKYKHENYDAIKNISWRYIISGYRLSSGTYNPTITFAASGVAGLGKASTPEEVLREATEFLNGLTNPGSTDAFSYGTGYFIGQTSKTPFGLDFSTGQQTSKVYSGEGYLLWRGNFFSDTTLPEQPEPEPEPEPEQPELPVIDGLDYTIDVFGDEILLPEIN